jgi:hypothetical protein
MTDFWLYLEMLDEKFKRESGEADKFKFLEDPKYEAK